VQVTAPLARFIAESRWEDAPAQIRNETRRALLNAIGCMLGGRPQRSVQIISETFPASDMLGRAVIFAAATTAQDYDDTHLPTVIHPSAPVLGVLLAMSTEHAVSGREFLHAFLLGIETTCRMGNAVSPGHYQKGWHITGTCGVFGAAAAAAKVLKFDASQTAHALGLAATQAAGLVEMLGSSARVLNAGFAARNGISAALLAQNGLEAPAHPIEGLRGFVNVFGENRDFGAITGELGSRWELRQVGYKRYPCGVVLQALIDASLELRRAGPAPRTIEIRLHPLAIERGDRPRPRDGNEARLSAQHCSAVALLYGAAGAEQFTDSVVAHPEVEQLRARVRIVRDDSLDKAAAVVSIDGRTLRVEPRQHVTDAELEGKFRRLAGARGDAWLRWIDALDSQPRVELPE
jgi:2-methylcitrate dehydratase PrpD